MPRAAVPMRMLPEINHLSAWRCAACDAAMCSSRPLPDSFARCTASRLRPRFTVGRFMKTDYSQPVPVVNYLLHSNAAKCSRYIILDHRGLPRPVVCSRQQRVETEQEEHRTVH